MTEIFTKAWENIKTKRTMKVQPVATVDLYP